MLQNQETSRKKTTASFLLSAGILCLIVIGPNILTFEPYAIPEKDAVGSVAGKEGIIFYLDNRDGTYDIYVDDQYFKTTVEIFDKHIPIYDSLEEVKRND